ncbi:MAG: hypothetical protein KDC98_21050, partial [Planctomycetes bacterium]|nr:hypothetical protein [Planctomycetota bacterium]
MIRHLALSFLVAMAAGASLVAQANTISGLDGHLAAIDSLTYFGRRGSHPNGEVGMAMQTTVCNSGSVNIDWFAAMQPNHPKFAFLVARVANDRIEQISDRRTFCKHVFQASFANGTCGTCQNPGSTTLLGVNCSDTYGQAINADRYWLAPAAEIDPWLGTWNPIGSYFDVGDPLQVGYPLAADGVRSLVISSFDSVKNRITVDEQDLLITGASYYYGMQLVIGGEALANRGDNMAHRGFLPAWNGASWSISDSSVGQQHGSILGRWPGASVHSGTNGADDGRIFVASKVTALGGGAYHYEYAVHNVDSSRGVSAFRVPIDASATASNFTFGDVDNDPANDWSAARVGNFVVFSVSSMAMTNTLEWNTIFNFGFDADFAPGAAMCELDAARIGPGALWTSVQAEVPSITTIASFAKFGQGCPISQQIAVPTCAQQNPAGGTLAGTTSPEQHVYRVGLGSAAQYTLTGFEIWTRAPAGQANVNAYVFAVSGTQPAVAPIASTTVTVGSTPGFYSATFNPPVTVGSTCFIGFDTDALVVE